MQEVPHRHHRTEQTISKLDMQCHKRRRETLKIILQGSLIELLARSRSACGSSKGEAVAGRLPPSSKQCQHAIALCVNGFTRTITQDGMKTTPAVLKERTLTREAPYVCVKNAKYKKSWCKWPRSAPLRILSGGEMIRRRAAADRDDVFLFFA